MVTTLSDVRISILQSKAMNQISLSRLIEPGGYLSVKEPLWQTISQRSKSTMLSRARVYRHILLYDRISRWTIKSLFNYSQHMRNRLLHMYRIQCIAHLVLNEGITNGSAPLEYREVLGLIIGCVCPFCMTMNLMWIMWTCLWPIKLRIIRKQSSVRCTRLLHTRSSPMPLARKAQASIGIPIIELPHSSPDQR